MNYVVPDSFWKEVAASVIMNEAKNADQNVTHAQFLAISGPPGSGKSFLTRKCCEALNAPLETVAAASLAGPLEGQALYPLLEAYERAGNSAGRYAGVVLVDDSDKSVMGDDPKKQHTNSRDLVDVAGMAIADDGEGLRVNDASGKSRVIKPARRPLVIFTLNDRGKLYHPLKRFGRMNHMIWDPAPAEKMEIVAGMLPQLGPAGAAKLVRSFPHQSVAFFGQLGPYVAKEALKAELSKHHLSELRGLSCEDVAHFVKVKTRQASYKQFYAAAKFLNRIDLDASYLKSGTRRSTLPPKIANAVRSAASLLDVSAYWPSAVKGRNQ